MSYSFWPHGPQHTRLPCPPLSPRVCTNSCPSSGWRYVTISFSATPYPFTFNLGCILVQGRKLSHRMLRETCLPCTAHSSEGNRQTPWKLIHGWDLGSSVIALWGAFSPYSTPGLPQLSQRAVCPLFFYPAALEWKIDPLAQTESLMGFTTLFTAFWASLVAQR